MDKKFIWLDGELVESQDAVINFLTPALHYGAAVFEGIRAYDTPSGPAIFRLNEHVERIIDSAHVFGFRDLPWDVAQICDAVKQVVHANAFSSCYIRPLIFWNGTVSGLNMDGATVSLGIAAWDWKNYLGEEALAKGIRANISSFTRHQPNIMMTKAKISGNYANSILAKTESKRLGFDEAIMLNPQGYVAECSGENIFVVRKGRIITPPQVDILEGITRDSIIAIATDMGIPVQELPVSRDQLYIADEVFVCGTAAECIGLREIDFRTVGDGKRGPITKSIQQAFDEIVHGKVQKFAQWLDYVNINLDIPQFVG
jgi:branched-chain amino acid aminotransferase